MWRTIAALVLLATFACNRQPRLDLSSDQALGDSMADVNASLSPEDRVRFSNAFATVARQALGGGLKQAQQDPEAREKLAQALSGKTAAEVIAEAETIRAKEGAEAN